MSAQLSSSAAVTAAAMRAAAGLIEQAGIGGLRVSCDHGDVTVHVSQHDGDAAARSGRVAVLAGLLGVSPARHDSRTSPDAFLEAAGQIGDVPVTVFTPLAVHAAPGGAGSLAAGPAGQQAAIGAGQPLPPGWRWVTDLDEDRAAPAAGRQVA